MYLEKKFEDSDDGTYDKKSNGYLNDTVLNKDLNDLGD